MAQGDHLYNCYAPPAQEFVRGEGPYLYTDSGERYLDFIAGIAVSALGHGHPELVDTLKEQSEKLWHLSNMFRIQGQYELADRYCESVPFADKVFFTNSGAEAVECAMKTARRYHHDRGDVDRYDIITFTGAFHGRTMGTINAGGNPKYLEGFGPALPGFIHLEFGDHDALEDAIGPNTAAVLVEPVQGEGGLRPMPEVCLHGLRRLCDEHGALLIFDEVQCGMGRTGKLFAHQWAQTPSGESVEPDIMAIAKGVGGGFPFGACLASREVASAMVPGTHGSTYGGNPLAMAVGAKVLDIIDDEGFLQRVTDVSNFIKQQFEGLRDRYPDVVDEIRGKGLLIGMKLHKNPVEVRGFARDRYNLLVGSAGDNVLRLAPPLIITEDHVREAIGALEQAFEDARALPDVEQPPKVKVEPVAARA